MTRSAVSATAPERGPASSLKFASVSSVSGRSTSSSLASIFRRDFACFVFWPARLRRMKSLRLLDELLLLLVVGGHLLHPLVAQLEEALVVAGILDQLPVRQLDDLFDRAIEKRPVVRDEQIAALERLQKLFEELDAGQIEMVGRLVEQEQIDISSAGRARAWPGSAGRR